MKSVGKYLKDDPSERDESTPTAKIDQSCEPISFKGFFQVPYCNKRIVYYNNIIMFRAGTTDCGATNHVFGVLKKFVVKCKIEFAHNNLIIIIPLLAKYSLHYTGSVSKLLYDLHFALFTTSTY